MIQCAFIKFFNVFNTVNNLKILHRDKFVFYSIEHEGVVCVRSVAYSDLVYHSLIILFCESCYISCDFIVCGLTTKLCYLLAFKKPLKMAFAFLLQLITKHDSNE